MIEAATAEFAHGGLDGTSTDDIATRVGISQPYLFRLFRTKKELFLAVVERLLRPHDRPRSSAAADGCHRRGGGWRRWGWRTASCSATAPG